MDTLYEKIIDLCKHQNLSGKDFARLLGLKKSPLTDWKNNHSRPTLEQLLRMCEIFAITPNDLLTDYNSIDVYETELLMNYNKLDSRGQHRVHTVIYEELDRIDRETAKKDRSGIG